MSDFEPQSEQQQAQGEPSPTVLFIFLGEGSEQLTPPDISSDTLRNPPNITPVAHREFLRKRRLLDKMEIELLFSGLPGREAVKDFILHLHANDKPKIPHRDNRKMPHPFIGF